MAVTALLLSDAIGLPLSRFEPLRGLPACYLDARPMGMSVTIMRPGACVMAKSGFANSTACWSVTPHAQNTGTSSSAIGDGSPKSGDPTSQIPIACGFPKCTGAPWAWGYPLVISMARIASFGLNGRIDTIIGPPNGPTGAQAILVRYIG